MEVLLSLTVFFSVGGNENLVGKPVVDGAKVTAQIVKQDRQRKESWFSFVSLVCTKKKNGHRQHFASLLIVSR